MKIAILFGNYSVGNRPFDFHYDNIWTCLRGLTGSDLAVVVISRELAKLRHNISLFTVHAEPQNKPIVWEGVKLFNYIDHHTVIDDSFDAVISINEPDAFRGVNTKGLKICWEFLNDFTFCQDGFEEFVDLWLSPCQMHMEHLKTQTSQPEKWGVLPLGCEPSWYSDKRIPGRVVWTSSCDRGLHWLLSCWPEIKKAVPYATLKIFYHFDYGNILNMEPNDDNHHPHVKEMGQRLRYCKNAITKMKDLGVEQVGSVSRVDIAEELSKASVFGFSADTVAFTEGFSVSALESHASFTVPVLTDCDCLGSIYKDSGCVMINGPIREHLPEFTTAVIKGLTDKEFADKTIEKCMNFAVNYTWPGIAKQMENFIKTHNKNQ